MRYDGRCSCGAEVLDKPELAELEVKRGQLMSSACEDSRPMPTRQEWMITCLLSSGDVGDIFAVDDDRRKAAENDKH